MKRVWLIALLLLTGCDDEKDRIAFNKERRLARVCADGTRVYEWQGKHWVVVIMGTGLFLRNGHEEVVDINSVCGGSRQ